MTLSSNQLIHKIETLLTICKSTLGSEDAVRLQQQQFRFQHVAAEELLLTEISRALSEQICDENVLSYFRMLLRYALIENRATLGGMLSQNTIELLQVSS